MWGKERNVYLKNPHVRRLYLKIDNKEREREKEKVEKKESKG